MTTSGGLGESETAGLTMNIVPKQGGNSMSGLFFASGFSESMQSDNFTAELQARGATQPTPLTRVYDVNAAVGGPIVRDRLWYYFSARVQGSRQNILNVFYNQNAGIANAWTYVPDLEPPGVLRPHLGELHAAHHLAGVAAQQVLVLVGRAAGLPQVHRHGVVQRLAASRTTSPEADGHGEFSPQRVQTARWTVAASRTGCSSKRASARPTTSGRGTELDPNPTRDLVRVFDLTQVIVARRAPPVTVDLPFAELVREPDARHELERRRRPTSPGRTASRSATRATTGSTIARCTPTRSSSSTPSSPALPSSASRSTPSPYNVNARALQDVALRAGPVDDGSPDAAGSAPLRPSVELVPRDRCSRRAGSSRARRSRKTDGVTGYHDITPRLGAAYDLFGNGKTALKVNLGKYLQGASVSNLRLQRQPGAAHRRRRRRHLPAVDQPHVARTTTATSSPDCDLSNLRQAAEPRRRRCGVDFCDGGHAFRQHPADRRESRSKTCSRGSGMRPSDWSFGAVGPAGALSARLGRGRLLPSLVHDVHRPAARSTTTRRSGRTTSRVHADGAERHAGCPAAAVSTIGPLYNINPNVFGTGTALVRPTKDIGDDTRVFNGVDVTFNLRNAQGRHVLGRHQHRQGRERLVRHPRRGARERSCSTRTATSRRRGRRRSAASSPTRFRGSTCSSAR